MPISFYAKSHGRIPIGFFNIETDMLLMDCYFFFSTDFCEWIIEWADAGKFGREDIMIYAIEEPRSKRQGLFCHSAEPAGNWPQRRLKMF